MMKRFAIALAVLLSLTRSLAAQSTDASGQWELTVPTNQGPIAVTMVLKKTDEKLTGTLKAVQGEGTGEGTQKGAVISITFKAKMQQGESVIVMNGTQDGDAMKGTLVRDGREPIEFTGKRGTAKPADSGNAVDVTGTWAFEVQSDAGTGTPTMSFKQDGDKITGNYSGLLGEAPLTGTLAGRNITITINANVQGTALTVVYSGTVESASALKGTVKLGDLGSGTFTAKKQ